MSQIVTEVMEKEIDPLDERKEIMQDVIDRHIKYGSKYVEALKKLNAKFPGVTEEGSSLNPESKIRVYQKPENN